jgi:hypothetical protein
MAVSNSGGSSHALWWGIAIVVGLVLWNNSQHQASPAQPLPRVNNGTSYMVTPSTVPSAPTATPTPDYNGSSPGAGYGIGNLPTYGTTTPSNGSTTPSNGGAGISPSYGTTHVGYENPAPGDDGTADCVPGQAPVYVGSNDPNGLDRDGDGWGCE